MFDQIESGSSFFKAAEHLTALAILVEPKSVDLAVPNTYGGQTTVRDEVTADITIFGNQATLDGSAEPQVMKGAKIASKALANATKGKIGAKLAVTVSKEPTKNGYTAYVFNNITTPTLLEALGAYVTKRDAAAVADMPDF